MATIRTPTGQLISVQEIRVDSLYSAFILEADGPPFEELKLFEYGLSQQVANSLKLATAAHTNMPRAGYAGLPMGHEMYVHCWRAQTNIRIDEPLMDWAAESSASLVYNDKTITKTPLLDLLMSPRRFWIEALSSSQQQQQQQQQQPQILPLWIRENISFHVWIQTAAKATAKLQEYLVAHTQSGRMIFWIYFDGVHRTSIR